MLGLVRYSDGGLNKEPFHDRTALNHLNTQLVRYSDPHCILVNKKFGLFEDHITNGLKFRHFCPDFKWFSTQWQLLVNISDTCPDFRSHSKSGPFACQLLSTIPNPDYSRYQIPTIVQYLNCILTAIFTMT